MERIDNTMKENPNKENIFWRNYTIEDATAVIEKAKKVIKAPNNKFLWKLCLDIVHDMTGFTTEPIKEIMKEVVDMAKKMEGEGF